MRGDRGVARKGIAGNGSLARICRVVGIDVFNLFLWRMIGGEYLGEYSKMYFVIVSRKVNDKCVLLSVSNSCSCKFILSRLHSHYLFE